MYRLAVVASHPIQYQAPWFRALARVVDLQVFYCHRAGGGAQVEAGFAQPFEWDIPLLDGYSFEWLTNVSRNPSPNTFAGCDTPAVARAIEDGGFDACLVNGWYLKSYLQAILACRRAGVPVLMRGDSQLRTPRRRLLTLAKHVPYRYFLSSIDAHLYVGRANRDYLRHYGVSARRLFFTPHFVDNERFARTAAAARDDGSAARLRHELGVSDQTILFLFAGKLLPRKRPGDFVEALGRLRRLGHDVHGALVGSGPLEDSLREQVVQTHAPVSFLGFKNQTAIPLTYAAADCLVLPSDGRETWGLVVNEAMACAIPAVVSDEVGCHHDLIGRDTGAVFPVGDIDRLTGSLADIAARLRNDRARIVSAVLDRIRDYSREAAVKGTCDALDAVTAARSLAAFAGSRHG